MPSGGVQERLPVGKGHRHAILPTTYVGNWAVGLAVASIVANFSWKLMGPLGGFPSLIFGLAGGIVALVAIFRRGERAVTVFAALLPFLGAVVFVLAELLIGHD